MRTCPTCGRCEATPDDWSRASALDAWDPALCYGDPYVCQDTGASLVATLRAERDEARAVAQDLRHKLARARGAMYLTRHGFAITDAVLDETACTDPPEWLVEEVEG